MADTMTTIRVDKATRDRLAELAEAHGRSLGAEVEALLDDLAWLEIEDGYRRLAADGAALSQHQAEADQWVDLDLDALASGAAEEYPEYNGALG
jgi:hypothetical protein